MQWLINEFKDFKAEVGKKIDAAVTSWAAQQIQNAAEFEKLKGEIKAMKARAGKNKE
jgi:hypothetical protein